MLIFLQFWFCNFPLLISLEGVTFLTWQLLAVSRGVLWIFKRGIRPILTVNDRQNLRLINLWRLISIKTFNQPSNTRICYLYKKDWLLLMQEGRAHSNVNYTCNYVILFVGLKLWILLLHFDWFGFQTSHVQSFQPII